MAESLKRWFVLPLSTGILSSALSVKSSSGVLMDEAWVSSFFFEIEIVAMCLKYKKVKRC